MSWSAFGHKNMFNPRWHLRKERFSKSMIFYCLAMLISLAAECTATYSLTKYEHHQTNIERLSNFTAQVHNNNLIDAEITTIVFCVLVATLFGADFFFLLFWPKRTYPRWYNITKKILAVIITAGMLAAAIVSNAVVTKHSETITGVSPETAQGYVDLYFRPPLKYRTWSVNVAYVVLLWIAFAFTAASTVLMFLAVDHEQRYGPESFDHDPEDTRLANEKAARTSGASAV
ncbi:hypothetical protein M422DRAFT_217497 [Sphaerobolus stellatus SS14]|uniref:Unplaced genomic scaffold SPHSTscaffold_563, whole genome shotgun sequence n=1 Tax=Sphaerobolus stellatus (strain SS14) TaxID=990650 RepID=A0A0C9UED8_SPHS4|nr:hypothetical protein M422DRAFT_217497 [Sphaerobolus stellatus SS14]